MRQRRSRAVGGLGHHAWGWWGEGSTVAPGHDPGTCKLRVKWSWCPPSGQLAWGCGCELLEVTSSLAQGWFLALAGRRGAGDGTQPFWELPAAAHGALHRGWHLRRWKSADGGFVTSSPCWFFSFSALTDVALITCYGCKCLQTRPWDGRFCPPQERAGVHGAWLFATTQGLKVKSNPLEQPRGPTDPACCWERT